MKITYKQVERWRLEQGSLSDCVRRPPGAEGSIARTRATPHWPLKNLIIKKIAIAAKVTLDGAGEIHDVIPTELFGNESKITALEREDFRNTVCVIKSRNFHTVDLKDPEKMVMNSCMTS